MLNVVVLIGRLTADPEIRYTPSNVPVTTFTIAVNRSYVKQGTERQTDFIDIVAWRSTAEFVCKYFKKGQQIAVQGSLQTRSYTDSQGNRRKAYEVIADNVHFVDSKQGGSTASNSSSTPQTDDNNFSQSFANGNTEDFAEVESDDDLPF